MLMNERIPKNGKVNNYQTPIILLERTVSSDKKDIKYIEHTCHNTPGDSTTGNTSSRYLSTTLDTQKNG